MSSRVQVSCRHKLGDFVCPLHLHTPPTSRSPPAQLSHHTSLLPSLLLILKVSFASSCGTLSGFPALLTSHSHIRMYRLKLEARICILEKTSDIYHSELMLPPQVFLAPSIFLYV